MAKKLLTTTIIGGAAVAGGVLSFSNNDESQVKEVATDTQQTNVETPKKNSAFKVSSSNQSSEITDGIVTPDFAPDEETNAEADADSYSTPAQEIALMSSYEENSKVSESEVKQESKAKSEKVTEKASNAESVAKKTPKTYVVESEDTMSEIAERFNINLDNLINWNGGSSIIFTGQVLSLEKPTENKTASSSSSEEEVKTPAQEVASSSSKDKETEAEKAPEPESTPDKVDIPNLPEYVYNGLLDRGWAESDARLMVDVVIPRESNWDPYVYNFDGSGAYGLFQLMPIHEGADGSDVDTQMDIATRLYKDSGLNPWAETTPKPAPAPETKEPAVEDKQPEVEDKTPAPVEEKPQVSEKPKEPENVGVDVTANVALAQQLTTMEIPYVWAGGTPEEGMDCSGLVQYVYENGSGISLPHNTVMQEAYFSNKPVSEAQVGDLLFWGETGATYHVGIYIGGGQYIDAPEPGRNVGVQSVADYQPSFAGGYIG